MSAASQISEIDAKLREAHTAKGRAQAARAEEWLEIGKHLNFLDELQADEDEIDRCIDGLLAIRVSAQSRV